MRHLCARCDTHVEDRRSNVVLSVFLPTCTACKSHIEDRIASRPLHRQVQYFTFMYPNKEGNEVLLLLSALSTMLSL